MLPIADADVQGRVKRDNPWWGQGPDGIPERRYPKRAYFASFCALALDFRIRRATVLFGPRRVGKTVMIKQLVHEAMRRGMPADSVIYVSIDTPVYSGISLEKFIDFMPSRPDGQEHGIVIFDEIQYLKNWEIHLKDLVDAYPNVKFIASGSAAAALRLKSRESGAGRFSDFMLPPLTFFEFVRFVGREPALIDHRDGRYIAHDVDELNACFIDYLNYGGYPEAVLNESIRANPEQFIKNDIIDKVLLKDLPSLYGITEIQELNRLFSFLAYNAGREASLENIAQASGLAKPTIKRYIEYLESAFLIIKLKTIDDNCRTLKRERNFKVYLSNPSMRAALFAPASADDAESVGHLAESAIVSQWQHSGGFRNLRYARWRNEGEVDLVYLTETDQRPRWIGEIKWSDRIRTHLHSETRNIGILLNKHRSIEAAFFTTRSHSSSIEVAGHTIKIMPSALYAYMVGRTVTAPLSASVETLIEDEIIVTSNGREMSQD